MDCVLLVVVSFSAESKKKELHESWLTTEITKLPTVSVVCDVELEVSDSEVVSVVSDVVIELELSVQDVEDGVLLNELVVRLSELVE